MSSPRRGLAKIPAQSQARRLPRAFRRMSGSATGASVGPPFGNGADLGEVMADLIERIVEQTIAQTLTLVTTSQQTWSVARAGMKKIYDDLALRSPGHPALERLKTFIAERDRPVVKH